MKKITQENLAEFRPTYAAGSYEERLEDFVEKVGVESGLPQRAYEEALRDWNVKSGIGFTEEEVKMLGLIYKNDEGNNRFDNDTFLHTSKGGNTAEHPMFMGLAFDSFKDAAGFTPDRFDPESPDTLRLAQLSQETHAMIAVHDVGEVIDVSFAEQVKTGASKKEPEEEALVAPFKFKMAAYALSIGQPELYEEAVRDLKESALAAKREYYQQAIDGKISGDEFVDSFGKVIGQKIAEAEARIDESGIAPAYAAAAAELTTHFENAEAYQGMAGAMLAIIDKYEGGYHYAHFAGKAAKDQGAIAAATSDMDAEQRMFSRIFGNGESASYSLANSGNMLSQMAYSQKLLVQTFDAADAQPEETREMAQKLAGASGAGIMRAVIGLLQKAPPFVDFSATRDSEPAITLSDDPDTQKTGFLERLEHQRSLRDAALATIKGRRGDINRIEQVMDTKALIAVFDKAAQRMESGEWRPDGKPGSMIFTPGEDLPEALRVSHSELVASSKKYPLDVASEYKLDQLAGQSVRL